MGFIVGWVCGCDITSVEEDCAEGKRPHKVTGHFYLWWHRGCVKMNVPEGPDLVWASVKGVVDYSQAQALGNA